MKLPLIVFAAATLLLQSGCVTGRRTLTLNVPTGSIPAPTKGKACIVTVTDERVFQNKPSDPSTPSIDGDVTMLSPEGKDRMIGRQRGGFGKAMGDIALADNDTVTQRVRALVTEGLKRGGYEVVADANSTVATVTVNIDKFWAWMTPGMWALTFESTISTRVTIKTAAGSHSFVVLGNGLNHGQVAKDDNWVEAYDPSFADYLANFQKELNKLEVH